MIWARESQCQEQDKYKYLALDLEYYPVPDTVQLCVNGKTV